jgi:L-seryl-tRNA(Ser) seleniumtransferase
MREQPDHLFRKLPQVGELLHRAEFLTLQETCSRALVANHLRNALEELRLQVKNGRHTESSLEAELRNLGATVEQRVRQTLRPSLRPVINATGVLLQTNLGRAPLSEAAIAQIAEVARGYCNLEMDLDTGERSYRDIHVEQLILDVLAHRSGLGREGFKDKAAAVVNNCAAACFLALNSLAEGGEVIVSRGELVEIGGGFRVPDILRKSGAILREVGTTNRTRISDYEAAITTSTRLILRVHRSNFRIEGFTERPSLQQLRELGEHVSIPVFEDQGTGCIVDLSGVNITGESSWVQTVASGISLVACSGDKLLGGPQCGILVGSTSLIQRIRSNPLFRAMRIDKLTYAALQVTLLAYLTETEDALPSIAMMRTSPEEIRQRCAAMARALSSSDVTAEVIETRSVVGGGTTPGASLPSFGLALRHVVVSDAVLAARLRSLDPPVIARSHQARTLLDLRTVPPEQDTTLMQLLQQAIAGVGRSSELQEHP